MSLAEFLGRHKMSLVGFLGHHKMSLAEFLGNHEIFFDRTPIRSLAKYLGCIMASWLSTLNAV